MPRNRDLFEEMVWQETVDPVALQWVRAVEKVDNASLEAGVKLAINKFCKTIRAQDNLSKLQNSCILMGARTLNGALTPFFGTAPTNNNFVAADYNRKTGLVGDAATKYLNTNYTFPTTAQNNNHFSLYVSDIGTVNQFIGGWSNGSGFGTQIGQGTARSYMATGVYTPTGSASTGVIAINRTASASFIYRRIETNQTASLVSGVIAHGNSFMFARSVTGTPQNYTNSRIAFYSQGNALNTIFQYDTALRNLYNEINAAID